MLHLKNNPDKYEFLMNNRTIRIQIAVLEVQYFKTRHINPVLVEVDMEFYHSLPPVQEILEEMTRLERLTISLKEINITTATTTTTGTLTPTPTAD